MYDNWKINLSTPTIVMTILPLMHKITLSTGTSICKLQQGGVESISLLSWDKYML